MTAAPTMPGTPAPDVDRLYRRFQGLQLRCSALQGQARELQLQQNKLTTSISLAKARKELAPLAAEAFTYLQEKAHRRAVGDFEDLLSAFVDDVIPEAGSIRLELGTERGAPSLDILLDNSGDLEDIVNGNGGALTNVVVTGLGYAALSRTSNRQLMVLDEPDCWIKAVNVPAFTKVVAEVANPVEEADGTLRPGCQTLMISHNDISLMDEGAHIQELRIERNVEEFAAKWGADVTYVGTPGPCAYVTWLEPKDGKPVVEVRFREDGQGDDERNALTKGYPVLENVSGARPWKDHAQVGVRWVEANNLRSHLHTRMELSAGLNVLTGGVNGGKSNLYFTAMRAMAYGETDDSMIRHGADSCTIRMGLENGVVLEMVRTRKGSPKVLYRRYKSESHFAAGKAEHEGRPEKGVVPEFIRSVLRIARVDGLDIQLRSQKEPVFLLTEAPSRRAQLLSVGRESGLLQELVEHHRLQVRRDNETLKREEVELNNVNRTLTLLAPLSGLAALRDIIEGLYEEAKSVGANLASTKAAVTRLAPLEAKAQLHAQEGTRLAVVVAAPKLSDTSGLRLVIARLAAQHGAAKLPDMPPALPPCTLVSTRDLTRLVELLAKTSSAATLPSLAAAPMAPQLVMTTELANLMTRLKAGSGLALLSQRLPVKPPVPELTDTLGLRTLGVALSTRATAVAAHEKELGQATTEADQAKTALHDLQHELGVCPTCNKPFDETGNAI